MSRLPDAYPDAPGFKVAGPSEEAAVKIAPRAEILRGQILDQFRTIYPKGATADEVARDMNLSVLTVRPRVSELHRNGYLAKTGERRTNSSGMTATVWRFVPELPALNAA